MVFLLPLSVPILFRAQWNRLPIHEREPRKRRLWIESNHHSLCRGCLFHFLFECDIVLVLSRRVLMLIQKHVTRKKLSAVPIEIEAETNDQVWTGGKSTTFTLCKWAVLLWLSLVQDNATCFWIVATVEIPCSNQFNTTHHRAGWGKMLRSSMGRRVRFSSKPARRKFNQIN